MTIKSFKTKLDLNDRQATLMAKHAGVRRYAYNWSIALNYKRYQAGEKRLSGYSLKKLFVATEKSKHEWLKEVSKCAAENAILDSDKAFVSAFTVKGRGLPKFKKKGVKDSFRLYGSIKVQGNKIKLPKIGWIRTFEQLPALVANYGVTISRHADSWYAAYRTEAPDYHPTAIGEVIGCDVGINALATLSNGITFANPKAYRRNTKRLNRLQRNLSRKQKGSKNRHKAQMKLARLHLRIANIRKDSLHKLTTYLAKNHSVVAIEDLNVSGMLRNHRLASAIADCGFHEFRRQLEYKTQWYGSKLHLVSRWYPSSKTCSNCGHTQPMPLQNRTFGCSSCHVFLNRDLNAAINLAVSYTVSVCGQDNLQDLGPMVLVEAETKQLAGLSDYV